MPSHKMVGWPLRASEFLTGEPSSKAPPVAERERRKPPLTHLDAWYESRRHAIIAEAPDLDTCMQRLLEATIEYQRPLADAYLLRHAAERTNLDKANETKVQWEKSLTDRVCADVSKVWHRLPGRQRSVHNITKILCNPKGTKRASTPRMERWKYRWVYKKGKTIINETIRLWTIRRYVNDAVKALKAALV